jgi:DNA-directed RNA polymerase sigma subunit (sigma70/sigma32)
MEAIDKFDASLGLRLVLFATRYIDNEIQKAVSSHSRFACPVSLDDTVFEDEDCKLTWEEVLSSGCQDYTDWNAMYGSAFQELKAVAKKLAPFEDAFIIWNDHLTMSELGYTLCDVAKKNHVTEEQAWEKIKDLNMRLSQHYGLRV